MLSPKQWVYTLKYSNSIQLSLVYVNWKIWWFLFSSKFIDNISCSIKKISDKSVNMNYRHFIFSMTFTLPILPFAILYLLVPCPGIELLGKCYWNSNVPEGRGRRRKGKCRNSSVELFWERLSPALCAHKERHFGLLRRPICAWWTHFGLLRR